jgi:putative oxidoreductase
MSKLKTYLPAALLALPLLLAGGAKLAGVPQLHASFGILGLPSWFGYFIGAAEVAGALGLFILPLQRLAAAGIAPIMAGALFFHLKHTPWAEGLPALLLLALSLWLALRRPATGSVDAEVRHG